MVEENYKSQKHLFRETCPLNHHYFYSLSGCQLLNIDPRNYRPGNEIKTEKWSRIIMVHKQVLCFSKKKQFCVATKSVCMVVSSTWVVLSLCLLHQVMSRTRSQTNNLTSKSVLHIFNVFKIDTLVKCLNGSMKINQPLHILIKCSEIAI